MARYALVIGIANYDHFRNLDKAVSDAAAIAQIFQSHGQYQTEPIPKRLIETENRWELAPNKKLTGKELGQSLETFLLEQAKDQEALIYFAGHGFEVPGLGRKKKGYLATSDSTGDGRNAILFSDLNDLIRESSLSSLVLILDCCHAGSFLERTLLESTLTVFKEKKDYYLITACRAFERAREGEEHGIFTAAVLRGLQVDNADSEGTVTGDRLFDFVQRELRQSGQEPIRTGTGRSIKLVSYQSQAKNEVAIVNEHGEIVCPYQGLQAFTAAQREFFFGRKPIIEAIKQKLEQQPFVPVIGASGSGKSSVVRAGLMPWLEESGWHILEPIKPGFEPLAALRRTFEPFFKRSRSEIQALHQLIQSDATGLAGVIERLPGNERYLLVVDQFEEIFTVCSLEADRQRFIELITQVVGSIPSRLAVVTTMRADFLEPCLQYPMLHRCIQSQAVFMPSLAGIDLRDVVTKPAQRQGYTVEESLLLKILGDVGKEPGFLPLLEFALTKLWEKRDRQRQQLTLEQYEKLGGLTGALNLHAECIYQYRDYHADLLMEERDAQEQAWIRRIFLRLVRTGEGEKDTRQRQPKIKLVTIAQQEPESQETIHELLEELIQGRLLIAGKDGQEAEWVDLAHEALIDAWRRFTDWRKVNRELRRLSDRLRDALRQWQNKFCDNELMMGGLLVQVRENWNELEPELDETERKFYTLSVAREQDRITQLQKALDESKQRQLDAEKNEIRALCKSSEALFASNSGFDALLEGLRAAQKLNQIVERGENVLPLQAPVVTALRQAVYGMQECNRFANREMSQSPSAERSSVWCVRFSPDGRYLATTSSDGAVNLWKVDGTFIQTLTNDAPTEVRSCVCFSADGETLASVKSDHSIQLWSTNGILLNTLVGHTEDLVCLCFSPNDQILASASRDGVVKLWTLDGISISTFFAHPGGAYAIVFPPDGQSLVSAGNSFEEDGVKHWDLQGNLIRTVLPSCGAWSLDISRDGQIIALATHSGEIILVDFNGQILQRFRLHGQRVMSIQFSPDGKIGASGGDDGTVKLWNLEGKVLATFHHTANIHHVCFSPDGQVIASASGQGISLWKRQNPTLRRLYASENQAFNSVDFSPDGRSVITGCDDGVIKLWNHDGRLIKMIKGHDQKVWSTKFSPNGQMFATASFDQTVKLWAVDGTLLQILPHDDRVWDVSFSPDGQMLVTGSYEAGLRLWHIDGSLIRVLPGIEDQRVGERVAFSPDGKRIIAATTHGTINVWNPDGTFLQSLRAHFRGVMSVAFSPDGQFIASSSRDCTAKLWSLDGRLLRTFQHRSWVIDVAFSPNEPDVLVTVSFDKSLTIWRTNGSKEAVLRGHDDVVYRISFSPDGQTLASASDDGSVILWNWNLNLSQLTSYGYQWLKDYLCTNPTVEESDWIKCPNVEEQ